MNPAPQMSAMATSGDGIDSLRVESLEIPVDHSAELGLMRRLTEAAATT